MQQRTRVKFCGVTRLDDVQSAVAAGADAVGLVFYPKSSRCVSLEQARLLRNAVPAFVDVVTLFVNPDTQLVNDVIRDVRPDLIQFHGDESPDFCESFNWRYFRAFRVGAPGLDTSAAVLAQCRRFVRASAWLFDSYSAGYGGSGLKLDARLLEDVRRAEDARPLILAGGLTIDNVVETVRRIRPYAVDVSSGVEDAPGIKSAEKMRAFFKALSQV